MKIRGCALARPEVPSLNEGRDRTVLNGSPTRGYHHGTLTGELDALLQEFGLSDVPSRGFSERPY